MVKVTTTRVNWIGSGGWGGDTAQVFNCWSSLTQISTISKYRIYFSKLPRKWLKNKTTLTTFVRATRKLVRWLVHFASLCPWILKSTSQLAIWEWWIDSYNIDCWLAERYYHLKLGSYDNINAHKMCMQEHFTSSYLDIWIIRWCQHRLLNCWKLLPLHSGFIW